VNRVLSSQSIAARATRAGAYAAIWVFLFFPIYWLVATSFKAQSEIFVRFPSLLPQAPTFDNFVRALSQSNLPLYLANSLITAGGSALLTTALGAAYALLLNQPLAGRAVIRAASLLPWVLPSTVTACLWMWLFHGQYGVINAALLGSGAIEQPFFFLSSSWGAMLAIIVAKVWLSTPLVMLFVLAALQDLPWDQVEAAKLDGAGDAAVVRYVVVPHIRRTLIVVLVLQALANLQKFDLIYAMTAGGPVRATMLLSLEVYNRAFDRWDVGMASAIGVIWFVTIAAMSLYYLRLLLQKVGRR